jgi:hypothetical protein
MRKLLLLVILGVASLQAFCQTDDNAAVKKVISNMFDCMRNADTIGLRNTFADGMIIQSINPVKDKPDSLIITTADKFIKIIGAPHKDVYDERITFDEVKIENSLATVWAPYKFYFGKKFSHCGVDVFQLVKTGIGWKIISVFYNVRTGNCPD